MSSLPHETRRRVVTALIRRLASSRLLLALAFLIGFFWLILPTGHGAATPASAPDPTMPSFTDVAPSLGVNQTNKGFGPNPVDYNLDGRVDLLFLDHFDQTVFFQQQATGQFTDITTASGLIFGVGQDDKHGAAWGDCENSGQLSLLMAFGTQQPSRLYHPNGDGTFTDIGPQAGVNFPDRGRGASWIDYDNDGHLDIFLTNAFLDGYADRLLHNNGNCTFTDVSATAGDIATRFHRYGMAWADYNNDGWMDVFAASGSKLLTDTLGLDANSNLYRNGGNGTFSDVTVAAGIVSEPTTGMAWGDYDNDGLMDLFVTTASGNRLYHNNGNGTFTDVAVAAGVSTSLNSQDAVWADFNNDGYLDLFVVNAGDTTLGGQPNFLYLNNGNGTFSEVAAASGAQGDLGVNGDVGSADVFGDGFIDLVITKGLSTNSTGGPHQVLRNLGNGNNWLELSLTGTQSNRLGIGARVVVTTDTGLSMTRQADGGVHQYTQNDLTLHFGMGTSPVASSVTIYWPSGIVQTLANVAVNQRLAVTEPSTTPPTRVATLTPTVTSTTTSTQTPTRVPTGSTRTPTSTATPSSTRTLSATRGPFYTYTPTQTLTPTLSPTATESPSATASPGHTATATLSPTSTKTWTPSPTATDSPTETPTSTASVTPTATAQQTQTPVQIFLPMVMVQASGAGGW